MSITLIIDMQEYLVLTALNRDRHQSSFYTLLKPWLLIPIKLSISSRFPHSLAALRLWKICLYLKGTLDIILCNLFILQFESQRDNGFLCSVRKLMDQELGHKSSRNQAGKDAIWKVFCCLLCDSWASSPNVQLCHLCNPKLVHCFEKFNKMTKKFD